MIIPTKLKTAARPYKLTPRELQTLALLILGEPWKGIAQNLGIHISTVRYHVANICRKLGCQSTLAAFGKIFLPDANHPARRAE